jgi:hypothetical protein
MQADLINPNDPRWETFLSSVRHDFYHLPGYSAMDAKGDEVAVAFLASEGNRQCLVPLVLMSTTVSSQLSIRDARSAYGYPGPLFTADDISFQTRCLETLVATLSRQGIVSCFLRLHPVLNKTVDHFAAIGALVNHGETIVIDLKLSSEDLWKQTREGHRYSIRKLSRSSTRAFVDTDWKYFESFYLSYTDTMRRVNASAQYFFPRDYFLALRALLQDRLHLLVVENESRFLCGALFTEFSGIVQYHLSATAADALKLEPSKLLLHFAREWAKSRGNTELHLGGGVGGQQDSLFLFKSGFSKKTLPFSTLRVKIQPARFCGKMQLDNALINRPAFFHLIGNGANNDLRTMKIKYFLIQVIVAIGGGYLVVLVFSVFFRWTLVAPLHARDYSDFKKQLVEFVKPNQAIEIAPYSEFLSRYFPNGATEHYSWVVLKDSSGNVSTQWFKYTGVLREPTISIISTNSTIDRSELFEAQN